MLRGGRGRGGGGQGSGLSVCFCNLICSALPAPLWDHCCLFELCAFFAFPLAFSSCSVSNLMQVFFLSLFTFFVILDLNSKRAQKTAFTLRPSSNTKLYQDPTLLKNVTYGHSCMFGGVLFFSFVTFLFQ